MTAGPMVFCSVCTKSHLRFTRAFFQTLQAHDPGRRYYVLVVDGSRSDLPRAVASETYVALEDVLTDATERRHLAFMFDGFEFACALKPLFARYLLTQAGAPTVVYVDVDMSMHAPLPDAAVPAGPASVVLTPHWLTAFAPDIQAKWMVHGAINAGYFAVRHDKAGLAFLDYWWDRCRRFCVWEPSEGLFADQPWLSLAPAIFKDSLALCAHPGINVSWWNLHERGVRLRGHRTVTGSNEPLAIFHWSQVQLDGSTRLFRHDPADDAIGCAETPAAVRELHARYVSSLESFSSEADRVKYRYASYADGSPIRREDRRVYRHRGHALQADGRDPFAEIGWFKSQRRRARLRRFALQLTGSNAAATTVAGAVRKSGGWLSGIKQYVRSLAPTREAAGPRIGNGGAGR